ncbi:MAG: pirin family protein [Spirochaetes bacterium]|nr:pirin family protein [Spirochaetota bacterium]
MSSILKSQALTFPWPCRDPFLFCAHHLDRYPEGDGKMGPAAPLTGRAIGQDFSGKDGWSMYHGQTVPGFPQHPHRGFETVTVTQRGLVDHSDSLGAAGRYGEGDVQWMTAGAGIVHCEMFPLRDTTGPNTAELFQIWLNLPAEKKLVPPHFDMFWSEKIPTLRFGKQGEGATRATLVAGVLDGVMALPPPPNSWAADPENGVTILVLQMEAGARWTLPPALHDHVRSLYFHEGGAMTIDGRAIDGHAALWLKPDAPIALEAGKDGARLLLLQGLPIGQPVAQYGPFVMNDEAGLRKAFEDYQEHEFGGWPWPSDAPVHPADQGRFARYPDGHVENP